MIIIPLLSCMLLLIVFASEYTASIAGNDLNIAFRSANQALNKIKEAENSGADVSLLIQKFNEALDFLRQARTSEFKSCLAYEACIKNALNTFSSISNDSLILQEETKRASSYENILVLGIYIPIAAFLALLSIFYIYYLWKLFEEKKFLNREIKRNQEK